MHNIRLSRIAPFLLGAAAAVAVLAGAPGARAAVPLSRNSFEFLAGAFSLSTSRGGTTSIGAFHVSYGYNISDRWRAGIGFQNIVSGATGFGSSLSGFDFFGQYCLFNCVATREAAASVAAVETHSAFGLSVGLAASQRTFQLTTQSLSFSGPSAKATGSWFWSENLKVLGSAQYSLLSNGNNQLNLLTYSVGLGVDW